MGAGGGDRGGAIRGQARALVGRLRERWSGALL